MSGKAPGPASHIADASFSFAARAAAPALSAPARTHGSPGSTGASAPGPVLGAGRRGALAASAAGAAMALAGSAHSAAALPGRAAYPAGDPSPALGPSARAAPPPERSRPAAGAGAPAAGRCCAAAGVQPGARPAHAAAGSGGPGAHAASGLQAASGRPPFRPRQSASLARAAAAPPLAAGRLVGVATGVQVGAQEQLLGASGPNSSHASPGVPGSPEGAGPCAQKADS